MHLRAPEARPSVRWRPAQQPTNWVRNMAYRKSGAMIASLSAVALMLAASETSARSGSAHRAGVASRHSTAHQSFAHALRHHRRNDQGTVWPAYGDYSFGPTGEPTADFTQPLPGDIRNTQAYDIPWDWAHRYPPMVTPSARPYVPSCPSETVKVPGHNGEEQTVSIMRCY